MAEAWQKSVKYACGAQMCGVKVCPCIQQPRVIILALELQRVRLLLRDIELHIVYVRRKDPWSEISRPVW